MTTVPLYWQRSDLHWPQPFDSIFFDIDGVLIQTIASYRAANIAVTEYIVGQMLGLHRGEEDGRALVTPEDVELFKRAGGFNSDWDLTYLLTALSTARLREWRQEQNPLAQRSMQQWAELAHEAAQQRCGGLAWVKRVMPASACPVYDQLTTIYDECYWGATELRKRLGREPRYLTDARGLVHLEKMLYQPDFFRRLRALGVRHLGIITGRNQYEIESAQDRMEAYSGERWWDSVIIADEYIKPDPAALYAAMAPVGTQGGLYVGDTADDLDLVRFYRQAQSEGHATQPEILAAMVVYAHEVTLYQRRGADVLMPSVEGLLTFLSARLAQPEAQ